MIADVCARIISIGSGVSGIITGIDPAPVNLLSGQLPAMYIFTGQAQRDHAIYGVNRVQVTRMYRVQVAVIPIAQGNPNTRESTIRPLLVNTLDAFEAHPRLNGLAGVRNAEVIYDTGVVILNEYGQKYIGFEIGLQVVSVEPRTIAKGE